MSNSHNGWPVLTGNHQLVPLEYVSGRVRAGDVHTVFAELCRRYHAEVEPIVKAHSWGHNHRRIADSTTWSNHASGTAVDLNAPAHPLGTRASQNFSSTQIAAIRRILADLTCVRWLAGTDPMHFEIRGTAQDVAGVAAAISKAPASGPAAPSFPLRAGYYFGPRYPLSRARSVSGYYSHREDLRRWQHRMRDRGWTISTDGLYGPQTERVARAFQRDKGLTVDGLIGRDTWSAAWTTPIT